MQIVTQLDDIGPRVPSVLTIGCFDGVHRGHQSLVRRVAELAASTASRSVLVTCWPHSVAAARGDATDHWLTTHEEMLQRLRGLGLLDLVVAISPASDLSTRTPDEYLRAIRDRFDIRGLVAAQDFASCHDSSAGISWLRRASETFGVPAETVSLEVDGAPITSARIGGLIAAGDVAGAAELLGYRYMLEGTVIHGDKRGRQLGFPTANLAPDPIKLLPGNGIYAVLVRIQDDPMVSRPAVASVGVRPTFGEDGTRLVEAYLLDTYADLYDQRLQVEFVMRLREERRYSDVQALIRQMRIDVDQARGLLAAHGAQMA